MGVLLQGVPLAEKQKLAELMFFYLGAFLAGKLLKCAGFPEF
jgi:hypothetical protein